MEHSAAIISRVGRLRSREEKIPWGYPEGYPEAGWLLCRLELSHSALCCQTCVLPAAPKRVQQDRFSGPVSVLFLGVRDTARASVNFTPAWPGSAQNHGSFLDSGEKRLWPLPGAASFSPPAGSQPGQRLPGEGARPAALRFPSRLWFRQGSP